MRPEDEAALDAEIIRRVPGSMPVVKAAIARWLGINPPRPYHIRDPEAAHQPPLTAEAWQSERGQPRNQE